MFWECGGRKVPTYEGLSRDSNLGPLDCEAMCKPQLFSTQLLSQQLQFYIKNYEQTAVWGYFCCLNVLCVVTWRSSDNNHTHTQISLMKLRGQLHLWLWSVVFKMAHGHPSTHSLSISTSCSGSWGGWSRYNLV